MAYALRTLDCISEQLVCFTGPDSSRCRSTLTEVMVSDGQDAERDSALSEDLPRSSDHVLGTISKSGVAVHTCNPSIWEVQTGRSV